MHILFSRKGIFNSERKILQVELLWSDPCRGYIAFKVLAFYSVKEILGVFKHKTKFCPDDLGCWLPFETHVSSVWSSQEHRYREGPPL